MVVWFNMGPHGPTGAKYEPTDVFVGSRVVGAGDSRADFSRAFGTELTDCNLRQGARHLKGTYKGDFFPCFCGFGVYFLKSLNFFGLKTMVF